MTSNDAVYPLKFNPIFKQKVWGGSNLRFVLGKQIPADASIGESWELVDRGDDASIIRNGKYAGKSIRELIGCLGGSILGSAKSLDSLGRFPLLIKYLDATRKLSIQVHPDDEMAARYNEADNGKTELWCVLHASDDASIIYGCEKSITSIDTKRDLTREDESLFHYLPVKNGDVIFLPAGQVHALLSGCVVLEIQKNSDVTYRLYDWQRLGDDGKPRQLHLKKGVEAIKFPQLDSTVANINSISDESVRLISNDIFTVDCHKPIHSYTGVCTGESFQIATVIEGQGTLHYNYGSENIVVCKGDIILLPASLGEYSVANDDGLVFLIIS